MPAVEEWKQVVGWEGYYEVSSLGRVRTVPRIAERLNGGTFPVKGRIRKACALQSGHLLLNLRAHDRSEFHYVHRLVVRAFIGEIQEGMEVRHLNGNPADNRLENLAIGTRSDQRLDDVRNGVHGRASLEYCKRGHRLVMPLLVPRRFKADGHRICQPCNWATMNRNRNGWDDAQVELQADFYAQRLMEEGLGWTPRKG